MSEIYIESDFIDWLEQPTQQRVKEIHDAFASLASAVTAREEISLDQIWAKALNPCQEGVILGEPWYRTTEGEMLLPVLKLHVETVEETPVPIFRPHLRVLNLGDGALVREVSLAPEAATISGKFMAASATRHAPSIHEDAHGSSWAGPGRKRKAYIGEAEGDWFGGLWFPKHKTLVPIIAGANQVYGINVETGARVWKQRGWEDTDQPLPQDIAIWDKVPFASNEEETPFDIGDFSTSNTWEYRRYTPVVALDEDHVVVYVERTRAWVPVSDGYRVAKLDWNYGLDARAAYDTNDIFWEPAALGTSPFYWSEVFPGTPWSASPIADFVLRATFGAKWVWHDSGAQKIGSGSVPGIGPSPQFDIGAFETGPGFIGSSVQPLTLPWIPDTRTGGAHEEGVGEDVPIRSDYYETLAEAEAVRAAMEEDLETVLETGVAEQGVKSYEQDHGYLVLNVGSGAIVWQNWNEDLTADEDLGVVHGPGHFDHEDNIGTPIPLHNKAYPGSPFTIFRLPEDIEKEGFKGGKTEVTSWTQRSLRWPQDVLVFSTSRAIPGGQTDPDYLFMTQDTSGKQSHWGSNPGANAVAPVYHCANNQTLGEGTCRTYYVYHPYAPVVAGDKNSKGRRYGMWAELPAYHTGYAASDGQNLYFIGRPGKPGDKVTKVNPANLDVLWEAAVGECRSNPVVTQDHLFIVGGSSLWAIDRESGAAEALASVDCANPDQTLDLLIHNGEFLIVQGASDAWFVSRSAA